MLYLATRQAATGRTHLKCPPFEQLVGNAHPTATSQSVLFALAVGITAVLVVIERFALWLLAHHSKQ
jgi:hypothetical protein